MMLETLQELADKQGTTMADIVRKAIANEKFFQDVEDQDGTILIQDKNKKLKQIVRR